MKTFSLKYDEWNWDKYPSHHTVLMNKRFESYTIFLSENDFKMIDNKIYMQEGVLPLPVQYRLLYETIIDLKPKDVFEVGCGWGNHLANISLITQKKIKVYGCDISKEQLVNLKKRNPWLIKYVKQSSVISDSIRSCDVVYMRAVLMHLGRHNLKRAINNIAASAKKHIVMTEDKRRDWPTIFRNTNPVGWEDAKIEKIIYDGGNIMVISK